jgi:mono/diheme cytochrome c family protein
MKLSRFVAFLLLATVLAMTVVLAAGSETKGKYYFKKNCKTCHVKGKDGGEVSPLTKTQAQWKKYFTAGTHNQGKEKLDTILTPAQLLDVETYLFNHASDSPQPETCGG